MSNRAGQGTRYYCSFIKPGVLMWADVPGSLGVLISPDNPMPVGQADCLGHDDQGQALFTLRINKQPLSGRWWLATGEFIPVATGQAPSLSIRPLA